MDGKERQLAEATNRSTLGFVADRSDAAARLHVFLSLGFLVLAGFLALVAALKLAYPSFLAGAAPFSYGRLAPMAMTAAVFGWLTFANLAATYYLLPRLTGARLWREEFAMAAGVMAAAVTVIGVIGIGLGFTDGMLLAEFYWPIDGALVSLHSAPLLVAVMTLRHRTEPGIYVSLWYVLAGLVWLVGLLIVGNIPGSGAVGGSIQNSFYVGALIGQWVVGVAIGAVYYVIPKSSGQPLFSRPLALAGFWSLAFAQLWTGPALVVFGPMSDWLETIGIVFVFGLIVPALAVAANYIGTMSGAWHLLEDRPDLRFGVAGGVALAFFSIITGIQGFRSVAAIVGLTPFGVGTRYAWVFIVATLLASSFLYHAVPRLFGRRLYSMGLARLHLRLTVWGAGAVALLWWWAGLAAGYAWMAGATTGSTPPVGATFALTAGITRPLYTLALLAGLAVFAGQLTFAYNLFRTYTSGESADREILVLTEGAAV